MKNDPGWIKLYRSITDMDYWFSEPFTRAQAWIDLLLSANHATGLIRRRGIMVAVDRGQIGFSEDNLAARWKWSRGKVRRFIKELLEAKKIEYRISEKTVQKKSSVSSLIYIINYDKYQSNDTENDTENGTGTRMKRIKNKRYVTFFDIFWNTYPSRNGKKIDKPEALKRYCQFSEKDLPLINQAAINYANSKDVKQGIGIRDAKRFLKDDYWKDWIESEQTTGEGSYIDQVKKRMGVL